MFKSFARHLRRFGRQTKGSASIEFVIVFPAFMLLFVSAFEAGLMQIRATMLERGLDLAVREVRLSTGSTPSYDELKVMICDGAGLIPNCLSSLRLEMKRIDPRVGLSGGEQAQCIDRRLDVQPVVRYDVGAENDLMLLRACVLFTPLAPTTGLGFQLAGGDADGEYALISMSAYVSEPL
ncbi:TadE/TadG family type IV pilus assembly protein [Actibacterium sp. 188UL27-1]|uniref:TadE/TadG family type IV pilus assembly protein n=1 Tax=Actibacterium sp. 188UL27-1 TaxID=2786961 RepID=UPI001959A41E|nr:TadE family protein [Actibacterium sp. 188UL27-1]MBM7069191.1 pilus assembly protein [Actibacterium sp. 188UL27-1]